MTVQVQHVILRAIGGFWLAGRLCQTNILQAHRLPKFILSFAADPQCPADGPFGGVKLTGHTVKPKAPL